MTEVYKERSDNIHVESITNIAVEALQGRIKDDNSSTFGSFSTKSAKTDEIKKKIDELAHNADEDLMVDSKFKKNKKPKKDEVDGEEKQKKKRERKKRKNPYAPTQPLSAYNYFVQQKMTVYRQNYPNCNQKDLMKLISKDWRKCDNKSYFKAKAIESRSNYIQRKNCVKVYHNPHKVKKPENSFILYMQDRTKSITEDQIENYQPPVPKPKKRHNKEKSKLNIELIVDPPRQEGVLINIKTGDVYEGNEETEERSQSDRRSTNPTTMTISCNVSECNDSILGNKDGDNPSNVGDQNKNEFLIPLPRPNKAKVNRTTLISQIAKEWKNLPEEKRKHYKAKAKGLMDNYKSKKKSKLMELLEKAINNRNSGRGVVKRHTPDFKLS